MQQTNYSRVETAKFIRKDLKDNFPNIKFSVRSESYAGGGAIRIDWTNGVPEKDVKAIVDKYSSVSFDGMIDMSYGIWQWVKDGKIVGTGSDGTGDSRGGVNAWGQKPPVDGAYKCIFNGGYVTTNRKITDDVYLKFAQDEAVKRNWDKPLCVDDLQKRPHKDLWDNWYNIVYKKINGVKV
jgi:hypothetical protein